MYIQKSLHYKCLVLMFAVLASISNAIAADSAETVIKRNVDAYNAHDIHAFMATFANDAEIYEFPAKLLMKGSSQIEDFYANKRFNDPTLHLDIANRIVMDHIIVDHEKIVMAYPEGPGRFEAIATYEVQGGKIQKITLIRGAKTLDSAK